MSEADERRPGEPGDSPGDDFASEPGSDVDPVADWDPAEHDGPAWVRGAGVRWLGVAMFIAFGVLAVLVLAATLLAIYDRARDDTPPPAPMVASLAAASDVRS